MKVQKKINAGPREKLNFNTPKSVFSILFDNFAFVVGLCSYLKGAAEKAFFTKSMKFLAKIRKSIHCKGFITQNV